MFFFSTLVKNSKQSYALKCQGILLGKHAVSDKKPVTFQFTLWGVMGGHLRWITHTQTHTVHSFHSTE